MTQIRLAHSPDADDASMFYALMQKKFDWEGLEFSEVREDIETLNKRAVEGIYDVSAISFHAYPAIADKYILLRTGACFGDRYGPIVVSKKVLKPKQLLKVRIAVPGKKTTAFLALRLYEQWLAGGGKPGVCYSEVPFDRVMEDVIEGKIDAGLIIHEGQLSYVDHGLHKIVDLGEWWYEQTALPLPLGGIVIRRDLPIDVQRKVARLIRQSIMYSIRNSNESTENALPFARGLDAERTTKFVGMYVNDWTIDCGRKGMKAVRLLLDKGMRSGVISESIDLEGCFLSEALPSSSGVLENSLNQEASSQPGLTTVPATAQAMTLETESV